MKHILLFIAGSVFISGCHWFTGKKGNEDGVLAKVGDKYLYANDIQGLVPPGISPKDSVMKVNLYVENWIKTQLLITKAELNLSDEMKNFERQINDFRNSLLIHAYQEKVVSQLLDTNVSENDIRRYYNENPEQFRLRKNIIKASYIIFSRNIKEKEKVKKWLNADQPEMKSKLDKFCREYAMSYRLNDTNWIFMDELEKIVPFTYSSQESFLASGKYSETIDSSMIYMVLVNEYKAKESISPLEFERPVIKSLILNIRKMEILRKMEGDIYQEALKNKSFENFVK